MNKLNPKLEPVIERMKDLHIDERGYPVPWFVAWVNGKPEFRASDARKHAAAIRENLCWVCGNKLGSFKTFVIGPMCGINRITAEPPCHLDCAEWSAINCPFLSNPEMIRREKGLDEIGVQNPGGIMLKRNPGATLLWTTKSYKVVSDGNGGRLIQIGEPEHVKWYCKGQLASLEEVESAVESGFPTLHKYAELDGEKACQMLFDAKKSLQKLYPKEVKEWTQTPIQNQSQSTNAVDAIKNQGPISDGTFTN